MKKWITKDSGKRKLYKSGFTRDVTDDKLRYDLIPLFALERLAGLYTRGAVKYGDWNWQKAKGKKEMEHFKGSLWRHYIAFLKEEDDEDHFAALLWNAIAIQYLREKLEKKSKE